MSKEKQSPLEVDDVLSFVLFLAAISFLAYVLVRTISVIEWQAPKEHKVDYAYSQKVSVSLDNVQGSMPKQPEIHHLEDDRTPYERKIAYLYSLAVKVGKEFDVDPNLIMAVSEVESQYTPEIIGGGVGLMQLIPFCHAQAMTEYGYSDQDLLDPYKNMRVGTKYLSYLLKKYDDIPFALVCYNKGEGGALGSGKRTSYYSDTVMAVYNRMIGGDICAGKNEESSGNQTTSSDT